MNFQNQGAPQGAESVLVSKWGLETMTLGYVAVPDVMLEYMSALNMTPTELVMVLQLMRFWWTAGQWPYPSKKTLAKAMGCSEKNAQKTLARLEGKGLIERVQRRHQGERSDSNCYDLSPLVKLTAGLAEVRLKAERERAQAQEGGQQQPHIQEQARQPWRERQHGQQRHGKKTLAASLHRIEQPYPLPPPVEPI